MSNLVELTFDAWLLAVLSLAVAFVVYAVARGDEEKTDRTW